jgi:hypothetical protein
MTNVRKYTLPQLKSVDCCENNNTGQVGETNDLGDVLAINSNSSIYCYFGQNCGLKFEGNAVQILSDGQINQDEGSYTVSDANGQLLFYTNGETIWNRNHVVMESGLNGDQSSATSAVVAVKPNSTEYFVFTVDENIGNKGFNYTVVDMSLNGGLGGVTTKNQNLLAGSNTTEKIGLVRHDNGVDWWIVTHGFNNNNFYAYQLSASGLNTTPVISSVGITYTNTTDKTGFIKDNFTQNKLAVSTYGGGGQKTVEIFDFDNATGAISNPTTITTIDNPYSIEFSPDDKYLYIGSTQFAQYTWDRIHRYNIEADNLILAWERTSGSTTPYHFGMQLLRDGKIYISFNFQSALSTIDEPNNATTVVNVNSQPVSGTTRTGLPYFPKAYLQTNGFNSQPVTVSNPQQGQTFVFYNNQFVNVSLFKREQITIDSIGQTVFNLDFSFREIINIEVNGMQQAAADFEINESELTFLETAFQLEPSDYLIVIYHQ